MSGVPAIVPSESEESRLEKAGAAPNAVPAVLYPIAACPWPVTLMEGIQCCRAAARVAAESKTVPDCTTAGVVVRLWISYQRLASRAAVVPATPAAVTRKLWAVHRVVLRIIAA